MLRSRTFNEARCLVTGASSPFGRALAHQLVAEGAEVILNGRSLPKLEALIRDAANSGIRAESMIAIDADLTEPEGRNKLIHAVCRRFGRLDLVVNAAQVGVGEPGGPRDTAHLRETFEINFFALIDLTTGLLPLLEAGHSPAIINLEAVASSGTFISNPTNPVTQAAIAAYGQATRPAWSRRGIHLLMVAPQLARTPEILASKTLQALQERRRQLSPASETSVGRVIRQMLSGRRKFETSRDRHRPETTRRLPRPHFGHRIQTSQKKPGD